MQQKLGYSHRLTLQRCFDSQERVNTPIVFDSFKLKEPQGKISRKLGGFVSGEWKNT